MGFQKSLGFKNFRTFVQDEKLKICPITLFLGGNGTGKSSIVRLFPMFKQTAEARSRGFLWYGNLVDFGNFQNIKSNKTDEDFFEINFDFTMPKVDRFIFDQIYKNLDSDVSFSFCMKFKKSSKGLAYLCEFTSKIIDFSESPSKLKKKKFPEISVQYDENFNLLKYKYDKVDCTEFFQKGGELYLFPIVQKVKVIKVKEKENYPFLIFSSKEGTSLEDFRLPSIRLKILEKIYETSGKKFDVKDVGDFAYSFTFTEFLRDLKMHLNNSFNSKNALVELQIFLGSDSKIEKKSLEELLFLANLDDFTYLTRIAVQGFAAIGKEIRYIGPIRSTIDRYYRHQELNLSDISHDGKNLALYLNSLNSYEKESLNNWLRKFFSFQIFPENVGSHIELKILEGDSDERVNLADTGFGYSQLLPIIIQIWNLENRNRDENIYTYPFFESTDIHVVLEQPELHLHPYLQARFSDALVDTVNRFKEKKINLSFIIETHSEALLDRFRELVIETKLAQEDLAIYFTEKDGKKQSSVRKCQFNETGEIDNWPIGFFSGISL